MEPEVLAHTTAPFFKGLDQDAGLGLSMAQAWQSSQEAACTYIAIQDSEQQLRSGYQWQPSEQPNTMARRCRISNRRRQYAENCRYPFWLSRTIH